MIELYEGVPGSGKSYHAVQDFLLPHVRSNRRLYIHIDGFHLDRLAAFEGRSLEELQKQITLWSSEQDVMVNLTKVEPGSAIFIDEAQTIFRAQTKVAPELLRWLETHRHYGVDLLMACQSHGQMTGGVLRLVEVTTAFRKLSRVGLGKRYQGKIRGNPEETEVIRSFTGKYDPKVYSYYSSYRAAVREQSREYSIFRSLFVTGSIAAGIAAVFFLLHLKDNPLSNSVGTAHAQEPVTAKTKLPPPPSLPERMEAGSAGQTFRPDPIHVEGSFHDGKTWRYLLTGGRIVDGAELTALAGGSVMEREEKGVVHPVGDRIVWGGPIPTKEDLQADIEMVEKYQRLRELMAGKLGTDKDEKVAKEEHSGKVEAMGSEPPRPAYNDFDPLKEDFNAHSGTH